MQSKIIRKLEIIANILIISVAVLLGYFLIQKSFFQTQNDSQPIEIPAGTKISLSETDWSANRKTLLLVLQKGCKFCTESMPFYKTLIEKSKEKGVKIVAVLPDSREESLRYLKENGVEIQEIRQSRLGSLNVRGTPALMLIDDKGEVSNSWIGLLPSEKEAAVMEKL